MIYSMFPVKRNRVEPIKKVVSTPRIETAFAEEKNILKSFKFFVIFSQFLGILPQENVLKNMKNMYFKWLSFKMLYTLTFITLLSVAVGCCFIHWILHGSDIDGIAIGVFYGGSLATMIVYLRLAMSWSKLIKAWYSIDNIMNVRYGYTTSLDKKINLFSLIFVVLGIADYLLSVANRYEDLSNLFGENLTIPIYYKNAFPQLFAYVPFNIGTAIVCTIITIHSNLSWACNDLFIIIISSALALRFQQISEKLRKEIHKSNSLSFWREMREDYDRLASFCKELDSHVSIIVLLSYFLNIFFLLIQLYHTLESVFLIIRKIYFTFSFGYLIFKTGSVSLYAAWINDESKVPTNILNSVDSSFFNVEIQRLLTQISFDKIALTGCKMFSVKRGIILSVASAIVTYELVLIQFSQANLYATQ
nr:gustatory receptor 6 [Pachyrhinus yasumatsui]